MAQAQGVRSLDLAANGIVDRVIPELDDAADEPEAFCQRLGLAVQAELARLLKTSAETRLKTRLERYRALGL